MDLAAQRRRTISRCHRRIVSGVTSIRSPRRRAFGITFSFRRCGCPRCITESWWRKVKISEVFHASPHRDSRSHVITLVTRRKTNRRHMISDHHGRATDIATSRLTATDGIIGTYNPTAPFLFLLNVAF
jgi:hypothetical protein